MVRNVHERRIDAPAEVFADLIGRLGSDDDVLFPAPAWTPMVLDRPLAVGADGGHGPIRYWVSDYEPGRRVRFTFHPGIGLDGYHEFTIIPDGPHHSWLRHVAQVTLRGQVRVLWPVAIRWLHDAVLEDLLDNAERAATGRVRRPAHWSWWVRRLRRWEFPAPRRVPVPAGASLVTDPDLDVLDAWQVPWLPGMATDPRHWATRIFSDPPGWVHTLLRIRNALVRLVGIQPADRSVFDVIAATDREALVGADDQHLDFRASIFVDPADRSVTVTTFTKVHNRRGKAYLWLVRRLHPLVIRGMLRRALHRLASTSSPRLAVPAPDQEDRSGTLDQGR